MNELEKIAAVRNSILLICMTVLIIVLKSLWPLWLLLLWVSVDYGSDKNV